jgi:hypothetical protein
MSNKYDFGVRVQNPHWSKITIEKLLEQSKKQKNTTTLIYAALECRNIIERLEFETIVMSANSRFTIEDFNDIKKKHGIQKANMKYNALKFKYQTFSEAFSQVVKPELTLKAFNYSKSEKIKAKLSQYLHIYSRTDEELAFESSFIQQGYSDVQSGIDFLLDYFSIDENGYYFGILDFETLSESLRNEFASWLNSSEQNIEGLTERLKKNHQGY